jgi:DNA-binding response OmpR family regulator
MKKRLLIIDDDAFIRELYQDVFRDEGFDVTIADNGASGLELLTEGGYDAVLLDVMLPKLDGLGVLTKLKETPPKTPNGPILLLTNLDHDPVLEAAKKQGAHSYVVKADILPPELVAKVNEMISQSRTPQPGQ